MTHTLRLEIAGLHIKTSFEFPIKPNVIHDPYRPFLVDVTDSPDIQIKFIGAPFPDLMDLRPVFNSGESWALYQKEDEYHLLFNPQPNVQKPFWQAVFDSDCREVTVFSGSALLSEEKEYLANPIQYPLDQLLLMYHLGSRDGVLIHAAGIEIHGRGYIFPGISGAGKSTLIRQFAGANHGIRLLSDDRIFLRKKGTGFLMYGTPWPGEAGIALNESAQLSGIFFLQHGKKNEVSRLASVEALAKLVPILSVPWFDEEVMSRILHLCEGIIRAIPAYNFLFKPERDVVEFLESMARNE